MKYYFIAIVLPDSFDSKDSSLAFSEEFPLVRTQRLVFIPVIEDAGNDLFIDRIWYIHCFEQKNLRNTRYLQVTLNLI